MFDGKSVAGHARKDLLVGRSLAVSIVLAVLLPVAAEALRPRNYQWRWCSPEFAVAVAEGTGCNFDFGSIAVQVVAEMNYRNSG